MKNISNLIILFCCVLPPPIYSWNALGHRLVAQIAYDNINDETKRLFNKYNRVLNRNHKAYGLVNSSVWMDKLYSSEFSYLKPMHYIDIPFTNDNSPLPMYNSKNAVYAVRKASNVLLNPNSSPMEKAIATRMIWHIVGDIHQPLHAATRITNQFPSGDRGGNLVKLKKNPVARNLHAYWDRGGGFLSQQQKYTQRDVKQMAKKIENRWPCHLDSMNLNPMNWASESHTIAINQVYGKFLGEETGYTYQQMTQRISERQIALAGCRLAALSDYLA